MSTLSLSVLKPNKRKALFWGVFLSLAMLYLRMLPQRLSWVDFGADGGDFLAAILTGGVPHPSGYPTYLVLGGWLANLPWNTPVWRAAALSAIATALACALFAGWLNRFLTGARLLFPGLLGAVAAGLAPLVWGQAVIVEVYGLNLLFFVLGLWWAALLLQPDEFAAWQRVALAVLFGLGLGNHLTLGLTLPAILAAYWIAVRRQKVSWQETGLELGGMLLSAAAMYAVIPLRARGFPPVNWGNAQTGQALWWLVSGKIYQGFALQSQPGLFVTRIAAWAGLMRQQLGLIGLALAMIGLINAPLENPAFRWLTVYLVAAYSIFAIAYATRDSVTYLLPVVLMMAAWMGMAVGFFHAARWRQFAWGNWLPWLVLALILARLPVTFRMVDPRTDTRPADFAGQLLALAPPDAIILAQGDYDAFPLWYYVFGLGTRPDVMVVVEPLTAFSWYQQTLAHNPPQSGITFPPVSSEAYPHWLDALLTANPDRPVCRSSFDRQSQDIHIQVYCPNFNLSFP